LVEPWTRRAAAAGQLLVPVCNAPTRPVTAPWARLREVVDLLLDNAVTHARPGTVRVELGIDGPGELVCAVVDSGPGLDEHQLATATEPFVRFGERGRLGIGLALASRLALAAGGTLELTSDGASTRAAVTL